MKKLLSVMVVALVISLSAVSASAINFPFFTQDDFTLTFGTAGNAGSANSQFVSTGRVITWNINNQIASYKLEGTNTLSAQSVGTQWITTYDKDVKLTIYEVDTPANVYWEGTIGFLTTIVNQDGSLFPVFPRPAYVDPKQSLGYNSIGYGHYEGTGVGAWAAYTAFEIPWIGTYNWNYVDIHASAENPFGDGVIEKQKGNAQGMLTVPEAGTMLLLGFGLMGLAYVTVRRKK